MTVISTVGTLLPGTDRRPVAPRPPLAVAEGSLRQRHLLGHVARSGCIVALAAGCIPLVAEIGYTAYRGVAGLSVHFLLRPPVPPGIPGGGISTAIAGSAEIVGLALAGSVPVALLVALLLRERPGRFSALVRFVADVLAGVPSIVVGIFAYAALVRPLHKFSDFAAAFAVAVLMLPIMVRADEEAIRSVPVDLSEAGLALGARRSRVARSVVLRGALPGLVVGNLLAVARGVGETAPLLFTLATPVAAMTLLIYSDGTEAYSSAQQVAWSTAFVLLAFVLALSAVARVIAFTLDRHAR